jgi:hypothetical protein
LTLHHLHLGVARLLGHQIHLLLHLLHLHLVHLLLLVLLAHAIWHSHAHVGLSHRLLGRHLWNEAR